MAVACSLLDEERERDREREFVTMIASVSPDTQRGGNTMRVGQRHDERELIRENINASQTVV